MTAAAPDIHELAKMVRRIDDRQQLTELISRYGMAVDDRDFDTIGRLFTEDGEFHGVKGRQTIVDYYRARTATFGTSYHYAHTQHFDFESDDSASGVVNAHAELCIGGKTVRIALRYLDRYRRSAQGWQFRSRTLKFRYVLPFDEVANGLADPMRVRWPGTQPQMADLPDKLDTYIASRKANTAGAVPPTAR
jgi:hypothetical protein